jgi:hypothetical protein
MSEEKKPEISIELALEAAREVSTEEAFIRFEEIINGSLTEEEQEQKIEEVLEELTIQVNEIYQRKKQEK